MKHKEIIVLLFLTLIFLYKPIINHTQIISVYYSDLITMGTFTKHLFTSTLFFHNELPLWNPYIFSGTPFISNSQSAMFYPPNYLFLLSQSHYIWTIVFTLNIFLMGAFTYLFAKKINISSHSSLIAAIIYMFSGPVVTRIYVGHSSLIEAMVWFPLILLLYEYTISTKKYSHSILTGIVLTLMFFTGHVQFLTYALFVATIYYILRVWSVEVKKDRKTLIKLTTLYIISIIVMLSLIPIQLLPSLEFAQNIDRSGGISFTDSTTFSITPQWLITFIIPEFFGSPVNNTFWHYGNMWELCMYIGIVPLILVFISIIWARGTHRNIFLIIALFTLLFALGKYTPLYGIIYNYIPGFNLFRAPARILFIFTFSMSILAGIGMDFLLKYHTTIIPKITKYLKPLLLISIIALFMSVILKPYIITLGYHIVNEKYLLHPELYMYPLSYWYNLAESIYLTILKGVLIFTLILLITTLFFYLKSKDKISLTTFKQAIILLVIINLFLFGWNYVVTSNPKEIFKTPSYIGIFSSNTELYRTYDTGVVGQYILCPQGIELINGYDANYIQVYQNFIFLSENKSPSEQKQLLWFTEPSLQNLNILRLLNTKYIITKDNLTTPGLYLIHQEKDVKIYTINDTLPRAFIVRKAMVIHNKDQIFSTLQSPRFNIKNQIILEKNPNVPLINEGEFEKATITYYSPNKIKIYTNSTTPGFLVLSQTWYPGWKAYDNGVQIPIYKTNYALKSVYLTKGPHNITFIFNSDSYQTGKTISTISLIIITLILITAGVKDKIFKTTRYK